MFRLELVDGPSAAVASAGDPAMGASVGVDEDSAVERAPISARALDSERDAPAFFENVLGPGGIAVGDGD